MHEFDTDQRVLSRRKRLESEHGTRDPFSCSVVLCHHGVEVFDLADRDRGPIRLVGALERRCIGVTAIHRDRLGDAMPADGLREKPYCGLFVAMFGEQNVNGLAVFVHRTLQIPPHAFDFNRGFVHPPIHPHRALAPVERLLQVRTLWVVSL